MKSKNIENIIVSLDVGTTKICTIVSQIREDGRLNILGVGHAPSTGLSRGMVVNPGKTIESIRTSLKEAELKSGIDINSVTVGIAGPHIRCIQSEGIVAISHPDRIISEDDIERLYDSARSLRLSKDERIIDVIAQEFIIDGKDGIFDLPVGMFGLRMEAKVNILTGLVSQIDDLSNCVNSAGVDIDDLVLEPLASSYAVLNESEKKVGVAMIDIGGGTTDIAVFKKGVIKHTAGIGIAGSQVTNDISETLGIDEKEAERVKKEHGYALISEIINDDVVVIQGIKGRRPLKINKSIISRIIQARMEELFVLAAQEIKRSGIENYLPAGVVITGGGSLLKGTRELAQQVLGTEVNLGIPTEIGGGLIKEVESPIYATGIGLILHRLKYLDQKQSAKSRGRKKPGLKNILLRVKQWFDEL
ncbi:MAG: cell division protein FtsA [Ignavibacteria bacterium]|jgi:cell division protein FtsA